MARWKLSFIFMCLLLAVPCVAETIVVDPNGFADFTNIQDAIDYSWDGDTVVVRPGTYNEHVKFNGRHITLTSLNPDDNAVVISTIIKNTSSGSTGTIGVITCDFGENAECVITGFTIIGLTMNSYNTNGIECCSASPTILKNRIYTTNYGIVWCDSIISNNIIIATDGVLTRKGIINNNTIVGSTGKGILLSNTVPNPQTTIVKNNIIANCKWGLYCADGYANSANSYNCFWNNTFNFGGVATVGTGDFLRDPLFASESDYHLKSTAGRWTGTTWVLDSIDSPCIDRGDPNDSIGVEPNPNGGRINIGAYSGTSQASKSPSGIIQPVCTEYPAMDFNKDCKVDFQDFALFTQSWLDCNLDPPESCWE